MAAGLYHDGGSFLHQAGAAAKIVSLAGWFVAALALGRPVPLAALGAATLMAAAAAGLLPVIARFGRSPRTQAINSTSSKRLLSSSTSAPQVPPSAKSLRRKSDTRYSTWG